MKHSDIQKLRGANSHVACSGNRLCRDCREARKKYKRINNKHIRRSNKQIAREDLINMDKTDIVSSYKSIDGLVVRNCPMYILEGYGDTEIIDAAVMYRIRQILDVMRLAGKTEEIYTEDLSEDDEYEID
ncbi:hypothetical protein LC76P1_00111 [Lysinibacillus phage LC76P1]|nr:hypothetical protein LC76P1_00111 [Lysinibacillus phage LC76P1]